VARYLAGRGITIPVPPSLRWAPSLRRPDGTHGPAMVARVDGLDGELVGVHRTWFARNEAGIWHRRDRAALGPIAGGAVRLAPAAETLLIGEGIETCLAAMQATRQPAWAALSTSGMTALMLPAVVRFVVILADNDVNGTGERAARTAAQRWLAEGRLVRIAMSPEPGTDLADVLAGHRYAQIEEAHDVAA
jgi:putative DNA primase/helicase